jgi:hypothetical protein
MTFALLADCWGCVPVAGHHGAVQDDEGPALVLDPFQRLGQVGGLRGEHLHAFGLVAVGGRAGQSEPGAQQGDGVLLTKLREHEHGLLPAGRSPAALTGPTRRRSVRSSPAR